MIDDATLWMLIGHRTGPGKESTLLSNIYIYITYLLWLHTVTYSSCHTVVAYCDIHSKACLRTYIVNKF